MNLSILIVGAIAISVILGYKTKHNTGLFAMCFAYILGCFVLGLKTKAVIAMWPISVFFVIFSVSLFYNFAMVNGTLEKMALLLLYRCRKFPRMLPYVLFFAAAFIAAIGAGFFAVLAVMAPVTLILCDKAKLDKLVGAVAINCGALSGGDFMISGLGVIFRGLMDEVGFAEVSFNYTAALFGISMVFSLLFITLFLVVTGTAKGQAETAEIVKPEPFDPKQRTNIILILLMMLVVLIFPILHIVFPKVAIITTLNSRVDVGLVAIVFAVIAMLLNLGDEKKVIAKLPWSTLIMISGVGMLIAVAVKAGTLDLLSKWVGSNVPAMWVPVALALVGACMSFFSSTTGVVCPALFPLVPALAQATGVSPMIMFISIVIGAQSSAISPFSSGGSLILGSCATEEDRTKLFPRLLFIAVPVSVAFAMIYSFVVAYLL